MNGLENPSRPQAQSISLMTTTTIHEEDYSSLDSTPMLGNRPVEVIPTNTNPEQDAPAHHITANRINKWNPFIWIAAILFLICKDGLYDGGKWVITKGIPKLCRQITRLVEFIYKKIIPNAFEAICDLAKYTWTKVGDGLFIIGDSILKVIKTIYNDIMTPLGHLIREIYRGTIKLLKHTWTKVGDALFTIGTSLLKVIKTIYDDIMTPLGHLIRHIYKKIIPNAFEAVCDLAKYTWTKVGDALFNISSSLLKVIKTIYNDITTPLGHLIREIYRGTIKLLKHTWTKVGDALFTLSDSLLKLLQTIYDHIFTPAGHTARGVLKALHKVARWTWTLVSGALGCVVESLVRVIQSIYAEIITPIGHAIHDAYRVIRDFPKWWDVVIVPIGAEIALRSRIIWNNNIVPLARSIIPSILQTKAAIAQEIRDIRFSISEVINTILQRPPQPVNAPV